MSSDSNPPCPPPDDSALAALIHRIQQHCLSLLNDTPAGVTEHTLITHLAQQGVPPFHESGRSSLLSLFQKHFLLFHALYRLRCQLPPGRDLHIHCLDIRLSARATNQHTLPGQHDALASYYLDLKPLYHTDAAAVDALLQFGHTSLAQHQQIDQAYATLALKPGCKLADIKSSYRQLAMTHHPDRGGNSERFLAITQAFDILVAAKRE